MEPYDIHGAPDAVSNPKGMGFLTLYGQTVDFLKMSDDQLIEILNALKKEPWKFTRQVIGKRVMFVSCNTSEILGISSQTCIESFFIIKNEHCEIAGCVYDMKYDLHWLILKRFRGNGYLVSALKRVILPFIFNRLHRSRQSIRILASESNLFYGKSAKVAKSAGFRRVFGKTKIIGGVGEYHHFTLIAKTFFSNHSKGDENN